MAMNKISLKHKNFSSRNICCKTSNYILIAMGAYSSKTKPTRNQNHNNLSHISLAIKCFKISFIKNVS